MSLCMHVPYTSSCTSHVCPYILIRPHIRPRIRPHIRAINVINRRPRTRPHIRAIYVIMHVSHLSLRLPTLFLSDTRGQGRDHCSPTRPIYVFIHLPYTCLYMSHIRAYTCPIYVLIHLPYTCLYMSHIRAYTCPIYVTIALYMSHTRPTYFLADARGQGRDHCGLFPHGSVRARGC